MFQAPRAWLVSLVSLALGSSGCQDDVGTPPTDSTGGSGGSGGSSGSASVVGSGGTGGAPAGTGGSGTGGGCEPGVMRACYTGPAGTEGVGICKGGAQACDAQGSFSGPCLGEVLPQPETCNTPVDDDCNGQTNEGGAGCVCIPNEMESCYTGPAGTLDVGLCAAGVKTCDAQGTGFGPCAGEITPQPESCFDDEDDDCNGEVNEDGAGCVCTPLEVVSCYSGPAGTAGVGVCTAGTKACNAQGTAYGPCLGEVLPQIEDCLNALDDDCDGQTNEGCECFPGQSASCYAGPEGTLGVGICAAGMRTCDAQGLYGPCIGDVTPQPESCLDMVDNDCNGQVDEGCVCAPGSTASCYTGPEGTLGVGLCAGGTMTCNGLGTAYGSCVGQVLPQPEDCATAADEDCDGNTPPCPGAYAWAKSFGSSVDDEGITVATDASNNVLLGGYMNKTVDFGCGPLTAGATDGALLVKFSSSGTCLWSKRWGVSANVSAVAADAAGNVYLTGVYTSSIDFGGGAIGTAGGGDVYVAKLDHDGHYLWAKGFGDSQAQIPVGLAVDGAGDVITVGYFTGSINFGGGNLASAGSTDIYVAKLSTAGVHQWSKRFGDSAGQLVKGVATDAAGDVVITGAFNGSVDFGGGPLTSAGLGDAFIAKLSPTGAHQWSKRYGDATDQMTTGVAIDAAGNVVAAGYFDGSVDLGAGPIATQGSADVFLVKLSSSGAYVWGETWGGVNNQSALSLAMDPTGAVAITGVLTGTADFGGGPLTNAGGGDIYIAKYDASGAPVWSQRYGDTAAQGGKWIAMDTTGAALVTGIIFGPADFGGGSVPHMGGEDIFLAKLGP